MGGRIDFPWRGDRIKARFKTPEIRRNPRNVASLEWSRSRSVSAKNRPILLLWSSAILLAALACAGNQLATSLPTPSQLSSPTVTPTTVQSPTPVQTVQSPEGVLWILEMLDGRPVITGATPTLGIGGSSYSVGDGCNRGVGGSDDGPPIAKPDGSISLGSYSQTLRFCGNEVEDQTDRYQSALMDARRYQVRDERLIIMDEDGVVRMVFSPKPVLPVLPGESERLVDTTWRFLPEESEAGGDESFVLSFLDPDLALAETSCGDYIIRHGTDDGRRTMFQAGPKVEARPHCPTDDGYGQDPSLRSLNSLRQFAVQRGGGAPRLMMQTYLGKFAAFEPVHRDTVGIFDGEWTLWAFGELDMDYRSTILAMDIPPVVPGTEVTANFSPAGIAGETFCGPYEYVNPWETMISADGQIATLGLPPHEHQDCSESLDISEQEVLYFEILSRLKTFRASQGYLIAYDREDRLLIFRSR